MWLNYVVVEEHCDLIEDFFLLLCVLNEFKFYNPNKVKSRFWRHKKRNDRWKNNFFK